MSLGKLTRSWGGGLLLVATAATSAGCETHIRVNLQETELFREDFNIDEDNLAASNPDFGGTLAYQGSRIFFPFFTESRVGTTLPHSEYVYYNRDPESFFSELSNTANWDPLSRSMSGIAVPTPTTTDPDNESTWHRETFSGGLIVPFGTIGGLWRMDR